jgi:hypothetical protein
MKNLLGIVGVVTVLSIIAYSSELVNTKFNDGEYPSYVNWVDAEELKYSWSQSEVDEMLLIQEKKIEIAKLMTKEEITQMYSMKISNQEAPNYFTRDALIKAINDVYTNQALKGLGEATVMAGELLKVNPRIIAGIASYESRGQNASGNWVVGNSWNSHNLNNISGMNHSNRRTKWTGEHYDYGRGGREDRYVHYPSVRESIFDLAYRLRKVYIEQGLETLSDIGAKYAPTNDRWEGLYGMTNHGWDTRVQYYYDLITNKAIEYTNEGG